MKKLKYIFVDVSSLSYFYNEFDEIKLNSFFEEINEYNADKNALIYLFFGENEGLNREKLFNGINLSYDTNKFDKDGLIKNKIKKHIDDNNLENWKIISFQNYETKDIIASSINSMKNFVDKNSTKFELEIDVISTKRQYALFKIIFENNENFKLVVNRFVFSKSYVGYVEVENPLLNISTAYNIDLIDSKINKKLNSLNLYEKFDEIENIINTIELMTVGINKNKIVNKIGEKTAIKILDEYQSLDCIYNIFDEIKINKNLNKENIKIMLDCLSIMKINHNINDDIIFNILKSK